MNTKAYEEWKASIIVARQTLQSSTSGPLPPKIVVLLFAFLWNFSILSLCAQFLMLN